MKIPRRLIVEMIVVLVIVLSCGGILWWPFLTAEVKPWEQGRDVPETPPAEDRRVHHPNYFSIVAPVNWEYDATPPDPASTILKHPRMTLWPKRSLGGRCAGIYVVGPFEMSSDLSGFDYHEATFQGQPAFFHVRTRSGTFDDPPQFRYRLFFERSGDGYELTYFGLLHQEKLPPMVQRYFDTFRVEKPAPKANDQ
jgi:hypothetical protein